MNIDDVVVRAMRICYLKTVDSTMDIAEQPEQPGRHTIVHRDGIDERATPIHWNLLFTIVDGAFEITNYGTLMAGYQIRSIQGGFACPVKDLPDWLYVCYYDIVDYVAAPSNLYYVEASPVGGLWTYVINGDGKRVGNDGLVRQTGSTPFP